MKILSLIFIAILLLVSLASAKQQKKGKAGKKSSKSPKSSKEKPRFSEQCHVVFSKFDGAFPLPGYSQPDSEIGSGSQDVEFVESLEIQVQAGLQAHFVSTNVEAQIVNTEITRIKDGDVHFTVDISHLSDSDVSFEELINEATEVPKALWPYFGKVGSEVNKYLSRSTSPEPSDDGRELEQNCAATVECSACIFDCEDCLPP